MVNEEPVTTPIDGQTSQTLIQRNVTTNTIYLVVATNTIGSGANACPATDSKYVTVTVLNPTVTAPTLVDGTITTICQGGSTTLEVSATATPTENTVVTYTWNPTTGLSNSTGYQVIASPTAPATSAVYPQTYTVTATVAQTVNGVTCTATNNNTVTVTVNNPAVVLNEIETNATDNTICNGNSATLTASYVDGSTNAELVGENKNVTYVWKSSNSNETISDNTNATITVSPSVTTTYTVTATAHVGNCTSTAVKTITITVNDPTVTLPAIAAKTICAGTTATFTAQPTDVNGTVTYKWTNASGDSLTNTQGYTTSNTLTGGTYTYTVTATAKVGNCTKTSTATATLTVLDPQVKLQNIDNETICYGNSVTLNAQLDGTPTGTLNYIWSNGTNGADATSITVQPTTNSDYTVTVTATVSENGVTCTKSDNKSVTVVVNNPKVTLNTMASKTVCYNGSTSLTVTTNSYDGELSYVLMTPAAPRRP